MPKSILKPLELNFSNNIPPNASSVIKENPDWVKDNLYNPKKTDAPTKPLDYSTLENNVRTNGRPLSENLFGGELDEPIKYDTRIDYLHSMIGEIIGGRYKICNVIHRSDDAPEVDYFAKGLPLINNDENERPSQMNKRPSQMNNSLFAKKICM